MKTENYNQLVNGYNSVFVNPNNSALEELRGLRDLAKAVDNAIKAISDEATQQALELAPNGGQFVHNEHTYQLQLTRKYDFTDHNKYKGEDAILWRETLRKKKDLQEQVKGYTAKMDGLLKSWQSTHKDWEPDEVQLTVKVVG